MKIALNLSLAWPDVKDVYDVGFDGCRIGRVWLAHDRPAADSPWEWLISIPMTLPDTTKGRAKSLNDALGAFAMAWGQVVSATSAARMERALELSRTIDPRPQAATAVPIEVTPQTAAPKAHETMAQETIAPETIAPQVQESAAPQTLVSELAALAAITRVDDSDIVAAKEATPTEPAEPTQAIAQNDSAAQATPPEAKPAATIAQTPTPAPAAEPAAASEAAQPAASPEAKPSALAAPAPTKPTILPGKVAMMPVTNLNIHLGGGKSEPAKQRPQVTVRKIAAPQIVVKPLTQAQQGAAPATVSVPASVASPNHSLPTVASVVPVAPPTATLEPAKTVAPPNHATVSCDSPQADPPPPPKPPVPDLA